MKPSGIITLTTDFGLKDLYVGVMKGVILSINPQARLVDVSHQLKMGSIMEGAALIQEAHAFFPKGTVHVGVVDPGVGGERRPILVKTKDYFFVGPDNGLFWPVIKSNRAAKTVHLTERKYFLSHVSHTFHGRDIFAPVAAYLSQGVDALMMGTSVSDARPLELPGPRQKDGILYGQVIRVDHFGNLITNIQREDIDRYLESEPPIIKAGKLVVEGVQQAYAEARVGEGLALIGSSDCLEIAVNLGRACERVGGDSSDLFGMKVAVTKEKG